MTSPYNDIAPLQMILTGTRLLSAVAHSHAPTSRCSGRFTL